MSRSPEGYPTSAFDYELPPHRIARHPAARRDQSRLLVVDRATGALTHRTFHDLIELIPPGDALVLNETRVFHARLVGTRPGSGRAEVLLLHPLPPSAVPPPATPEEHGAGPAWAAMVRPGARLRPGRRVHIADGFDVEILDALPDGSRVVRLETELPLAEALARHGEVPLPPYLGRAPEPEDEERYQTVYARETGSVAAPTAGLHFTRAMLETLEARGVRLVRLVLHVGAGTFRPVEAEDPAEHPMHAEWYSVPEVAAAALSAVREAGGRIWAVGTTVTRTLETVADGAGRIHAGEGWTALFIRPPYRFRAVDRLITNFHLPRSTLLMLVAALAGHELTMAVYREAVEKGYRFYSYGDAMVVL